MAETSRLLADKIVYGIFDRAKPAKEENRRFFEFALRIKCVDSP